MKKNNNGVTLIGHPFAPIGRGEDIRTAFRAFKKVMTPVRVLDVFGYNERDEDIERELEEYLVSTPGKINIFFINGNEIESVLRQLRNHPLPESYNIIYPAWELSIYPSVWAELIDKHFDEVWSQSFFVYNALIKAISKPVYHMPLATEVNLNSFLPRKYFRIPESSYVFLFFFDFRSYIERKNPYGVLNAFEKVCMKMPSEDVRLVIKLSGSEHKQYDYNNFFTNLNSLRCKDKVLLINRTMNDNEIKNLVWCSDCFISLHRSEGYGRGLAEAMCLGKPVVATAYSGNRDFMNENNSFLVRYELIPVKEGQYPHAGGQVWAEPDIDTAFQYMTRLISDKQQGRQVGKIASCNMRQFFNYRAIGLRYSSRINEIINAGKNSSLNLYNPYDTGFLKIHSHKASKKRNLPDFLIVGAARSGTTSLYHYLRQHPQIFMPDNKEPRFFAYKNNPSFFYPEKPVKTFEEYCNLFREAEGRVAGEASVAYLFFYKESIENIKRYIPDWQSIKIIIILRNPVERAYSHFALGRVLRVEEEELTYEGFLKSKGKAFYIKAGLYFERVKAYLETFNNVKIFLFDDLKTEPYTITREIFDFLGVDTFFKPDVSKIHNPTKKSELNQKTRRHLLNKYFKKDILDLQNLLGRDLSMWMK